MSYAERRAQKLTGWWYAEAWHTRTDGVEVRFRKRFKVKAEADGYEAYVKATGQEPPGMGPQVASDSFSKVAEAFLAANPAWGRRASGAHQRLAWACDHLGHLPVAAVRTKQLDAMVADLRRRPAKQEGKTLSPAAINRYLSTVAAVLRYAWERDLIAGVPKLPMMREDNVRDAVLSFEQEAAVCRWLEQNRAGTSIALVVRVLANTGMRCGEVYKLRPDQIKNTTVTPEKEQTKTNAARLVPIDANLARDLRAVVAAKGLPTRCRLWSSFKAAAKACGYDPKLTLHSLRHTRGTRLMAAGVDIRLVAEILGHSNINTTSRYTHPDEALLTAAAEKVHQARGKQGSEPASGPMLTSIKSVG